MEKVMTSELLFLASVSDALSKQNYTACLRKSSFIILIHACNLRNLLPNKKFTSKHEEEKTSDSARSVSQQI